MKPLAFCLIWVAVFSLAYGVIPAKRVETHNGQPILVNQYVDPATGKAFRNWLNSQTPSDNVLDYRNIKVIFPYWIPR